MSPRFASCLLAGLATVAQLAAAGLEFEVASVRASPPITPETIQAGKLRPQGITLNGGRVDFSNMPLPMLLSYAYAVPVNQITGPDWMVAQRFDIQATLPAGASEDKVPEMLQALLADRFKLTVHREQKEQSVFALVQAKGGAKVKPAVAEAEAPAPPADPDASAKPFGTVMPLAGAQTKVTEDPKGRGATVSNPLLGTVRASEGPGNLHLEAPSATLEGIAGLLTELLRQPVVDMTGLKGRYQIVLELVMSDAGDAGRGPDQNGAPAAAAAPDPRMNAISGGLDKIGLKLESRKMPVERIVVDHVEKTPTDN